ncbi:hypothetical protein N781_13245 [Pontibacillus halophilus JSM 076056 = DSM 19796]|uniref:HTH gntR-type domain-containing protein n=3 Tax=Pontibacillus TaxID=289201 RepID=A0A0A5GPH2_9BACI|nr:hypothetical protein N781_13245 [Pontibacillus halophilus JSM 076056 = DSM 19796]
MEEMMNVRMIDVSMNSRMPYYLQVKNKMIENIKMKKWNPGDTIPSESQMMKLFSVSRSTVRQAISQLVQEGVLETRRGKGTTVKERPATPHVIPKVYHRELGDTFTIKTIRDVSGHHMEYARTMLDLESKDEVRLLERVRFTNNVPFAIQQMYVPIYIGELFDERTLHTFKLVDYLDEADVPYKLSNEHVSTSLATIYESEILGISPGAPLLELKRTTLGIDNTPLEYCVTKYLPAYFDYWVEIRQ